MPIKKRCKCGNEFTQYLTTQTKCVECLIEKGRKEQNNEWLKTKKKWKAKNKTLSQLISEARKPFQEFIRLRDANLPCVSCGTKLSPVWDAGHFLKAELYSGMIFDEQNVHKQCRKCNYFKGGNEVEYRFGLIERYGQSFVVDLEKRGEVNRVKKYERQELEEIKSKYKQKIKEKQNEKNTK